MKKLIFKTYNIANKRKWNKICWAVDIHDVILESNYKAGDIPKTFLGNAKTVLQRLSLRRDTTLVLYTCSYPNEIIEYQKFFKENDIIFKYVNENPDCPNTAFGNFDKKFYYNILLEDKAGFEPEDWNEISNAMDEIDVAYVIEHDGKEVLAQVGDLICMTLAADKCLKHAIRKSNCTVLGKLDLTKNKK